MKRGDQAQFDKVLSFFTKKVQTNCNHFFVELIAAVYFYGEEFLSETYLIYIDGKQY